MYSNRLQPALQIILERVVQFFHPRSSCTTHISADVFGRQKSLIKPMMRQKTCNYNMFLVLLPKIVMHNAYIGRRSENNIKCIVHDDVRRKNQTTRYNCRFSATLLALKSDFLSFIVVEHIRFFHGALQLVT